MKTATSTTHFRYNANHSWITENGEYATTCCQTPAKVELLKGHDEDVTCKRCPKSKSHKRAIAS